MGHCTRCGSSIRGIIEVKTKYILYKNEDEKFNKKEAKGKTLYICPECLGIISDKEKRARDLLDLSELEAKIKDSDEWIKDI